MTKPKVSCIDLFCGAGGLTHGMALEGIDVRAGIDLDPKCRFPYEQNNDAVFIEADVGKMTDDEVAAYFVSDGYRVLAGCAPCQPFSTYSQRYDVERDGKWALLKEFARLAKIIEPDIITMENVPAVAKHRVYLEFKRSLERIGYHVWSDVVDCAQYGVPQTRRRFVLLASMHGPIQLIPPTRRQPRTVKQAIGRLPAITAGGRGARDRLHTASNLSATNMKRIRASKPGGTWRDWPRSLVADCHKDLSGKTYPSVYGRMEWNKPSPTLTTQCYGYGNGRFGHPEQDRAISLREAAVLQGFPRSYQFVPREAPVEFGPIGRLIGNAVPVDLARSIARSILNHLDGIENSVPARRRQSRKRRVH